MPRKPLSLFDVQRRGEAYRETFRGVLGERVLADLAKFCRANTTCFHMDPRAHAVAEGRREVWLRIQRHLNLTDEQVFNLAQGVE